MSVRNEQIINIVLGLALGIASLFVLVLIGKGMYKSFYDDLGQGSAVFLMFVGAFTIPIGLGFGTVLVVIRTGETWHSYFRQVWR